MLNVLEDVKNRLYVLTKSGEGWERESFVGAPAFGTVEISAIDPDESNDYFMTTADYLNPTSLWLGTIGKTPTLLKQLPSLYNSDGLEINQHFAVSADGTRIPYFMVSKKGMVLDGSNPTLLYGYGGFEISLQPSYSAGVGRAWTSQGECMSLPTSEVEANTDRVGIKRRSKPIAFELTKILPPSLAI